MTTVQRLDRHWIGGVWVPATGSVELPVVDPTSEAVFALVVAARPAEIEAAVDAARGSLAGWRGTSLAERAALLRRIAALIEANAERFAALLAQEIGCPLWFGRQFQVPMPVRNLAAMATALDAMILEEVAGSSLIVREPVGVVAAITPWNAPIHQIIAKLGAALAAGCTMVLKPSELTPLTVRLLADLLGQAGVPTGVVNIIFGDAATGAALAAHPGIDMVSFTGSVAAGRAVGAAAGGALHRVALELGGKSAAILLRDAPLETAVPGVVRSCFANNGQVCVAQTRLLVHQDQLKQVEEIAVEAAASWIIGAPLAPGTQLGPMATAAGQHRVADAIALGLSDGAQLLAGGAGKPSGIAGGFFVRPTIFTEVDASMGVAREEVFGPVLAILSYADEDEAVAIADSPGFGLSGAVWSANLSSAVAVARRMRTGQVALNGAPQNYATPFGGRGLSGFGRENGRFGIEAFLEHKVVHGAVDISA